MKRFFVPVIGMSCGKCVKAVETSVGSVEGVNEVNVNLADAKVTVAFDSALVNVDQIKETIEDQGYDVQ